MRLILRRVEVILEANNRALAFAAGLPYSSSDKQSNLKL